MQTIRIINITIDHGKITGTDKIKPKTKPKYTGFYSRIKDIQALEKIKELYAQFDDWAIMSAFYVISKIDNEFGGCPYMEILKGFEYIEKQTRHTDYIMSELYDDITRGITVAMDIVEGTNDYDGLFFDKTTQKAIDDKIKQIYNGYAYYNFDMGYKITQLTYNTLISEVLNILHNYTLYSIIGGYVYASPYLSSITNHIDLFILYFLVDFYDYILENTYNALRGLEFADSLSWIIFAIEKNGLNYNTLVTGLEVSNHPEDAWAVYEGKLEPEHVEILEKMYYNQI